MYEVVERAKNGARKILEFDSPYDAVEYVLSVWRKGAPQSSRLYVHHPDGTVLWDPYEAALALARA